MNGLYDAKLDGQPVLAITGMPYHDLIGTHTQQDVPLDRVFQDVAGPTIIEAVVDPFVPPNAPARDAGAGGALRDVAAEGGTEPGEDGLDGAGG